MATWAFPEQGRTALFEGSGLTSSVDAVPLQSAEGEDPLDPCHLSHPRAVPLLKALHISTHPARTHRRGRSHRVRCPCGQTTQLPASPGMSIAKEVPDPQATATVSGQEATLRATSRDSPQPSSTDTKRLVQSGTSGQREGGRTGRLVRAGGHGQAPAPTGLASLAQPDAHETVHLDRETYGTCRR